jgi:hypothetical protein
MNFIEMILKTVIAFGAFGVAVSFAAILTIFVGEWWAWY